MALENEYEIPFEVGVIVTEKNNQPCIELRRNTSNIDIIKKIVSCAYHNQPVTVLPVFYNRMRSLSALVEKGLIYRNVMDGKYYFNI